MGIVSHNIKKKKRECKTRIIDKLEYKTGRKMEIKLKKITITRLYKRDGC